MSTGLSSFVSRLLPVLSATIASWALMLAVPQVMRFEHGLQRIMAKVWYPHHQRMHGAGTQEQALTLTKVKEPVAVDAPFVIEMGNDPEKIFDADPLSPSDVAVLLDALKKSGVTSVMIGAPMAWPSPDPFALDALELVMAGFSSCVTSAALGRGSEAEPMPAAFVRASVPLARVIGSSAQVPVVNRISLAGTFLGRENTWAGFSIIESEMQSADCAWLIARWGDRIVFSSALLAVLVREEIHPEELVIEPGQFIQSPRTGHWWQIDPYGRGIVTAKPTSPADLQAPQMIRPEPEHLARLQKHRPPVHLLRAQGDALPLARQQQQLCSLYEAPRLLDFVTWYRLPLKTEWLIVVLLAAQAVVTAGLRKRVRWYSLLVVLLFWIVALRWGHTWIPLSPTLLSVVLAYRVRRIPAITPIVSLPSPVATVVEQTATPAPVQKAPPKRAKKKTRAKKKS
jgi:hypothetical protein